MRSQAVLDRWRSESDRVNRLVSGGVIDSQTRDETLSQFKSAEASHAESIAKVSTAEAELAKAQAIRTRVRPTSQPPKHAWQWRKQSIAACRRCVTI